MRYLVLLFAVALSGCATTAPQAKAILSSNDGLPRSAWVKDVPFVEQDVGHCGPATLTMAMKWAGHDVEVDDIASKVMTKPKVGSLQADMVGAVRREGMMAIRLDGYQALLKEIVDGHPVIIFENLGLSWYPQWHYATVVGYDLDKEEVYMHSGPTPEEPIGMKVFERSWREGDYWALVVLKPGQVSRWAGEIENSRAAAGLELAGHPEKAEVAYRSILQKWPESLSARIGLANVAYAKGDFRAAVSNLEAALEQHPESTVARHNLEVARRAAGSSRN